MALLWPHRRTQSVVCVCVCVRIWLLSHVRVVVACERMCVSKRVLGGVERRCIRYRRRSRCGGRYECEDASCECGFGCRGCESETSTASLFGDQSRLLSSPNLRFSCEIICLTLVFQVLLVQYRWSQSLGARSGPPPVFGSNFRCCGRFRAPSGPCATSGSKSVAIQTRSLHFDQAQMSATVCARLHHNQTLNWQMQLVVSKRESRCTTRRTLLLLKESLEQFCNI